MGTHEKVIVIDFGGQYNQLVARRVRECGVLCEIVSYKKNLEKVMAEDPKGIILTGGPDSVNDENAATCGKELFEKGIPVLGLCYGAQLMAKVLGGSVGKAKNAEYGKTQTKFDVRSEIFKDIPEKSVTWMSHFDKILTMPEGFRSVAETENTEVAAMENTSKKLFAIQFHPEVNHTEYGKEILRNFVMDICGCLGDWRMDSFAKEQIKNIREIIIIREKSI